ncbi:MAG: hypothetical protein Q4B62_08440 [Clostridiaceae bacterium]|nr:hypothetical protein [Clostridiaceae bacterium]
MNLFELFEKLSYDDVIITIDKINNAMSNLSKFGEKLVEGYIAFDNWWQEVYPKIYETITNIDTPEYASEKKKELIRCYKQWGEYGWTFNGQTKVTSLSLLPLSLEDANKKMSPYCTLENVSEIKNKLISNGVAQDDLEEAIFCFENGKYKSCAILLFALIDHELISKGFRYEPKANQVEGNYKIGLSAICEYRKENKKDYDKSFLYANLYFLNIMETLMTLFKDSNNFTNEPNIINRNFVVHGMSKRSVTEIDCFKVWSALYSLVVMLPLLEEMKV